MDLREASINNFQVANRHPWELARVQVVTHLLYNYISKNLADLAILDIGCGEPFVISHLSDKFGVSEAFAIDSAFTPLLIEKYKNELSLNSQIHFFDSIDSFDKSSHKKKIDIVLLLDVLEHIDKDNLFLEKVMNLSGITHNTIFLITVPAFQGLFTGHDIFLGHYRRYSNRQLKSLAHVVGLEIKSVGYFFLFLMIIRAIQKIYELIFGQSDQNGIGQWRSRPFLEKLFIRFLLFDFHFFNKINLLGMKWPGLSNYMVCQKPV